MVSADARFAGKRPARSNVARFADRMLRVVRGIAYRSRPWRKGLIDKFALVGFGVLLGLALADWWPV